MVRDFKFLVCLSDGEDILVQLEDGQEVLWPAGPQAEVSEHIPAVLPDGSAWWQATAGDAYAERVAGELRTEGVRALYHFTATANLRSICEVGAIYSKESLRRARLWPPPQPGGNDESLDRDRSMGNWPFVSLSLSRHTPMAALRRREYPIAWLLVDVSVAGRSGIRFTSVNAASPETRERGRGIEGLDLIDFELIRERPNPRDPFWRRYVQAEVLVPDRIPLKFVTQILFESGGDRDVAELALADLPHPPLLAS